MSSPKFITLLASVASLPLAALAFAGCGGSASASAPALPKTLNGRPATVGVANVSLGKILVNSQGRTLYLFKGDAGTTSTCTGACATAWPPLRVTGRPSIGSGANASLVRIIPRSDGKPQVTYNGHPLYLYAGDHKPGDTNGQGVTAFGGSWFAVSPAGTQVSGQGSNSGGGYGY